MVANRHQPCTSCGTVCCGGKTGLCRACLHKIPARERSGTFGAFQLRQSHLKTQTTAPARAYDSTVPDVPPVAIRLAAIQAAAHVPREHLADVLDTLGILDTLRDAAA
ncbi:hypothetical protein EDD28_2426 [Salana multivorans]|uniref:Uncharacterized protein n=1 Tax=Salana multivorans TaxID=120377 RepID=A0A3N2DDM2_9MICO|nr:hypothetical protein [Salana multivorans]ROR97817.1 hypothetical protein EDD28_2426 [Salana multivorans]